MPARLAFKLREQGHEVDTVPEEALAGHADPEVWDAAQSSERFFVTQDMDFSDVREFAPGTHFGLMLVRLDDPGREAVFARVLEVFEQNVVSNWARCFVVVTEKKVRTLRPIDDNIGRDGNC
jgi:predicted nuclease of predicted toxin-antitoxin system